MGSSISVLGDQFYFVALPWLTLQLTGSALTLSTVLLTAEIPRALLILFGGAIADRTSPRLVMIGSDILRGVLVGILASLVFTRLAQVWELYALSFLFGVVGAMFYPAFDSLTPALLPSEQLGAGNALLQGSAQLAGLLGPVLAGAIIAAAGTASGNGSAFAFDGVSFLVAALAVSLMRGGRARISGDPSNSETGGSGLLTDIKEGIGFLWKHPALRALLFFSLGANLAISGPVEIGLAIIAHNRFASAAAFGIMLAAFGLGALAGTILAGSVGEFHHRGRLLIGLGALFSVGMVLIAFASHVLIAGAVLLVLGMANGFIGITIMTWLQQQTPAAMMGRVMSLVAFSSFGLLPLSFALSGAIAQINVTLLFVLAGSAMGVVTIGMSASCTLRTFH